MINLLLIEDEAAIRDMLRFSLSVENFSIVEAENTEIARQRLANKIPDLILLDWMLPGKSGVEFICWIKQQDNYANIPIIMLTAKAEEENKIKGLTSGADDYVTKPFSPDELIARIKAVLRRGVLTSPQAEVQCQAMRLNTEKHQLTINGELVNLSPIEYKLLHFFMRHPNKTYSRDQLMTHVWGGDAFLDERTVDVQIRRLRDKLRPHDYHGIVKTIRGAGYQFSYDK